MQKTSLTAVFLFLFMPSLVHSAFAKDLTTIDKAIHQVYGKTAVYDQEQIHLTPERLRTLEREAEINFQHGHLPSVVLYTVRMGGDPAGFAFEDTVVGKWGPIHYLLCLDTQGVVKESVVLDYHEIRGKPVAKRRFLRQYDGKTINDPLRLRQDIDGITGATISSRSMTDGIRKLLHVFKMIREEQGAGTP